MAKRKPRVARPKEKDLPKGYDSRFEYELHQGVLKDWLAKGSTVQYTVPKTYHPDFEKWDDDLLLTYYLEAKGRFWDHAEYSKYIHIRDSLPDDYQLIFLFMDPYAPMPGAKVRKKCGTKRTHAEWADDNGFKWYTKDTLPKEFS